MGSWIIPNQGQHRTKFNSNWHKERENRQKQWEVKRDDSGKLDKFTSICYRRDVTPYFRVSTIPPPPGKSLKTWSISLGEKPWSNKSVVGRPNFLCIHCMEIRPLLDRRAGGEDGAILICPLSSLSSSQSRLFTASEAFTRIGQRRSLAGEDRR